MDGGGRRLRWLAQEYADTAARCGRAAAAAKQDGCGHGGSRRRWPADRMRSPSRRKPRLCAPTDNRLYRAPAAGRPARFVRAGKLPREFSPAIAAAIQRSPVPLGALTCGIGASRSSPRPPPGPWPHSLPWKRLR